MSFRRTVAPRFTLSKPSQASPVWLTTRLNMPAWTLCLIKTASRSQMSPLPSHTRPAPASLPRPVTGPVTWPGGTKKIKFDGTRTSTLSPFSWRPPAPPWIPCQEMHQLHHERRRPPLTRHPWRMVSRSERTSQRHLQTTTHSSCHVTLSL